MREKGLAVFGQGDDAEGGDAVAVGNTTWVKKVVGLLGEAFGKGVFVLEVTAGELIFLAICRDIDFTGGVRMAEEDYVSAS